MSRARAHTVIHVGEKSRARHAARVVSQHAAPYRQIVGDERYRPLFGRRTQSGKIVASRYRRADRDGNVFERSVVRADRAAVNARSYLSDRVPAGIAQHDIFRGAVVRAQHAAVNRVPVSVDGDRAAPVELQVGNVARVYADYAAEYHVGAALPEQLDHAARSGIVVSHVFDRAEVHADEHARRSVGRRDERISRRRRRVVLVDDVETVYVAVVDRDKSADRACRSASRIYLNVAASGAGYRLRVVLFPVVLLQHEIAVCRISDPAHIQSVSVALQGLALAHRHVAVHRLVDKYVFRDVADLRARVKLIFAHAVYKAEQQAVRYALGVLPVSFCARGYVDRIRGEKVYRRHIVAAVVDSAFAVRDVRSRGKRRDCGYILFSALPADVIHRYRQIVRAAEI